MSSEPFAVEFPIESREIPALEYAAMRVVGPREYFIAEALAPESEPSTLTLYVGADSPAGAEAGATRQYREIRREARLPGHGAPVSLVAFLAGTPRATEFSIFEARDMLSQRRFGLAVVAAQTYVEMEVRLAMRALGLSEGVAMTRLVSDRRLSCSLLDRLGQQLFDALTGTRPTAPGKLWDRYRAHVARRNDVVHHGALISEGAASESIDVAVEFVRFVQATVKAATGPA